ncbi:MAG: hypothetical protein IRZ08_00005, partial [Frankia sp.]|nr:hypothetical protein [Frankia sp.]
APPPSAPPAAGQDAEPGNAEGRGGESGDAGGQGGESAWADGGAVDAEARDGAGPAGPIAGGWPWALAAGATMCTGCPLCRLLATVVGNRPEVMYHLMAALSELAAAVRAAWAPPGGPDGWGSGTGGGQAGDDDAGGAAGADNGGHVPPSRPGGRRSRPPRQRVQRIDIQ